MPKDTAVTKAEMSYTGLRSRGRPKVKSDCVQRREIRTAARELFLASGYGRATTGDIAAKCGISKRTLYRLYSSKIDIFAAIIKTHRARMFTLPPAHLHLAPFAALEHMFRINLEPEEEAETEAILRIVSLEADRCPELREVMRRYGAEIALAELAGWLSERHNAGEIVIDDPHACAQILMDMVFGTLVKTMPEHPSIPRGQARSAHIRRCISIFLHGVATVRSE